MPWAYRNITLLDQGDHLHVQLLNVLAYRETMPYYLNSPQVCLSETKYLDKMRSWMRKIYGTALSVFDRCEEEGQWRLDPKASSRLRGTFQLFGSDFSRRHKRKWQKLCAVSEAENRLKNMRKELLRCPHSRALWKRVERQGPFTMQMSPWMEGQAQYWLENRTIQLCIQPPTRLRSALFELANAVQHKPLSLLFQRRCVMAPDEFAEAIERREYRTALMTANILSSCQNDGFWPYFPVDRKSITDQLELVDKPYYYRGRDPFYSHTDMYRESWFLACHPEGKKAWEADFQARRRERQRHLGSSIL